MSDQRIVLESYSETSGSVSRLINILAVLSIIIAEYIRTLKPILREITQ